MKVQIIFGNLINNEHMLPHRKQEFILLWIQRQTRPLIIDQIEWDIEIEAFYILHFWTYLCTTIRFEFVRKANLSATISETSNLKN